MTESSFQTPTPAEIEAQILAARKLRAETLAQMMTGAWRWLSHPRLGLRHA
jgi:hypothetical protein